MGFKKIQCHPKLRGFLFSMRWGGGVKSTPLGALGREKTYSYTHMLQINNINNEIHNFCLIRKKFQNTKNTTNFQKSIFDSKAFDSTQKFHLYILYD